MSPTAVDGPAVRGEVVLSLQGICKSFGAVHALDGVDLEIRAGEVVALLGDNGAGKSTLVKILAGVYPPDSGTIAYRGQTVTISNPMESRDLGIATVYQDLALCDNLDVVANLFLGRERKGFTLKEEEMEQRAKGLLAELAAKIPSVRAVVASLSGGQRQAIAIARSLVGDPAVVILDEPTAALGVEQTAEVLNLIERLRDRGLGVLVITHNMADVREVASKAVVLRLGHNNGVFDVPQVPYETIVAAITGAIDSSVTRRAHQRAGSAPQDRESA